MPRWLAWTLGALFTLALVLHAHGPLFAASEPGAGFSAADMRALLSVRDCLDHGSLRADPKVYFEASEAGQHPLGALSLAISTRLWSDGGAFGAASPRPLRAENLILLLIAAAGAGVFLRRLALPWLGDDHARAAAWVAAALCLVHPLAFAAVGSLAARGDLLALGFGTWACVEFLRGRQLRKSRAAIRAGVLALCAGLSSDLAWALPFALALAEFVSGRRYRTWIARARTASVTLLAYGLCVAIEPLLRSLLGWARAGASIDRPLTESLALAVEKLGVLALPVNPSSASFAAYLLAAAALVVALEPAFSAARSAPRLWSLILAIGALAVLAACFWGSGVRVQPGDFTRAEVLAAGLLIVSASLALASTALSGLRRSLMPAIVATSWAAIAHVHASAWMTAQTSVDHARHDVARAQDQAPPPAAVLLLDVPELVHGFSPLDRSQSQAFLAAPEFQVRNAAELELARAKPTPFLAVATRAAFVQFSRSEQFAQLRPAGIAVAIDAASPSERIVIRLPAPEPTTSPMRWFSEGANIALDWEALSVQWVSARVQREQDLSLPPFLSWTAKGIDGHFKSGEIQGVWVDYAGEPLASFDVAASAEWLCAGRILQATPVNGWSNLSGADAQNQLPGFDPKSAPQPVGDDWRIANCASPIVDAAEITLGRRGTSGTWRLKFCNLETLEQVGFELAPDSSTAGGARIAQGAGRLASQWTARGQAFAWCVEYAARGVVLVRDEGIVKPHS
ncbi:MAG TPA: hypothetical protein VK843_21765 [Planctomycetota bacterium]|nr:hypothetical protein [Planctomycetota bacterium]